MGHGPVPFFAGRSFSEDLGHTSVDSVWKHKSLHCVSVRIFFKFIYFCHTTQLVGSQLPDQGLKSAHSCESLES